MTIARRVVLLAAATPLVLLALGVLNQTEISRIETRSRFVSQKQIGSLSVLGNVARAFEEMRVGLRDHLRAQEPAAQAAARKGFETRRGEIASLLQQYGDEFVSDDKDRRMLDEFRAASADWLNGAEAMMRLADSRRHDEASALLDGARMTELASRIGGTLRDWIAHNQALAQAAGEETIANLQGARRHFLLAAAFALVLSVGLGLLTFRRIVGPVRALQGSVESIVVRVSSTTSWRSPAAMATTSSFMSARRCATSSGCTRYGSPEWRTWPWCSSAEKAYARRNSSRSASGL